MGISEEKMKIVINNYFKSECNVNTSIREAFEKGFRIGVKKGLAQSKADAPQTEVEEICDRADRNCNECWKQLHCRAKDTPQTDFVEDDKCFDCEDFFTCDEHQTDCGWK